jgi:hypothetical protein
MAETFKREPRIKVGIAIRRDQHQALREIAIQERHENVSLIVQRAIDRELDRVRTDSEAREPELSLAS